MDFVMHRDAVLSECGTFRYRLSRWGWADGELLSPEDWAGSVTFVMLNPSAADAAVDDPTVRRCIAFARRWRKRRLEVVNLFAFRATDPNVLAQAEFPIGPLNDGHLLDACAGGALVVAAWGDMGTLRDRDQEVMSRFSSLGISPMCLGVTKTKQPFHPLYRRADSELVPYWGRCA